MLTNRGLDRHPAFAAVQGKTRLVVDMLHNYSPLTTIRLMLGAWISVRRPILITWQSAVFDQIINFRLCPPLERERSPERNTATCLS